MPHELQILADEEALRPDLKPHNLRGMFTTVALGTRQEEI